MNIKHLQGKMPQNTPHSAAVSRPFKNMVSETGPEWFHNHYGTLQQTITKLLHVKPCRPCKIKRGSLMAKACPVAFLSVPALQSLLCLGISDASKTSPRDCSTTTPPLMGCCTLGCSLCQQCNEQTNDHHLCSLHNKDDQEHQRKSNTNKSIQWIA